MKAIRLGGMRTAKGREVKEKTPLDRIEGFRGQAVSWSDSGFREGQRAFIRTCKGRVKVSTFTLLGLKPFSG
ncbi:hypothetical protein N8766_05460 [bacterium]|nr:hypothetical protein [bacterium]